ncbi:glypican domain-containing protein [Phthorimaea operculella]|nr:glypican domain-containing protein [Phthorimaea operculella]
MRCRLPCVCRQFFRKLLQLSREEFHAMFKRTYGMIYEQHSYVFEQLFEQLERYLKCVNEHMRDIKPFEDVPHKLSVQLRRAFVATRTFHKALRAGADVVRNMMQVGVTQECVTAWARLRYCGTCSGAQPPACSRYCHNVLRGCLPAHADLGDQWDAYVGAEWGGPALERLVRETRSRLRNSRRYWSTLGPVLCTSTSVTTSPCFNGTDVGSYTQGPAGEGSAALASNPEVRSIGTSVIMGSTTAKAQQEALRTLTARLKDAYNGVEVQWKDAGWL